MSMTINSHSNLPVSLPTSSVDSLAVSLKENDPSFPFPPPSRSTLSIRSEKLLLTNVLCNYCPALYVRYICMLSSLHVCLPRFMYWCTTVLRSLPLSVPASHCVFLTSPYSVICFLHSIDHHSSARRLLVPI